MNWNVRVVIDGWDPRIEVEEQMEKIKLLHGFVTVVGV